MLPCAALRERFIIAIAFQKLYTAHPKNLSMMANKGSLDYTILHPSTMPYQLQPLTLNGRTIRLEPLGEAHVPDLTVAGQDETIWRFMRYGVIRTETQMLALVRDLLRLQERGSDLPFAVVSQETGRAVGMTRYLEIQLEHRAVEIGGTWYAEQVRRTATNTESKYLLLRHAFETLGCIRVQFKTDLRNERSQRAIERIGAVQEGILRNHIILPDGTVRSSVYYSILESEWPSVKLRLAGYLAVQGLENLQDIQDF
jgi:RimJ/RimL family protein N-acetyltransferase